MTYESPNFTPSPEVKEVNRSERDMRNFSEALLQRWENPQEETSIFYETMVKRNEGVLETYSDTNIKRAYEISMQLMDVSRKNPKQVRSLIENGGEAEA